MLPKIKTFPLNTPGRTELDLPEGSQPLGLFKQAALIVRMRDTDRTEKREFLVATIGADLPDNVYLELISVTNNLCTFEVKTYAKLLNYSAEQLAELDSWQLHDISKAHGQWRAP